MSQEKELYEGIKEDSSLSMMEKFSKISSLQSFPKDAKSSNEKLLKVFMDDEVLGFLIESILCGDLSELPKPELFQRCVEILENSKILLYVVNNSFLLTKLFQFSFSNKAKNQINVWIKIVQNYLFEKPLKIYKFLSAHFELLETLIFNHLDYSGFEELILKLMFCDYASRDEETFGFQRNLVLSLMNFPNEQKFLICYSINEHHLIHKLIEEYFKDRKETKCCSFKQEQICYILSEIILRGINCDPKTPHPLVTSLFSTENLTLLLKTNKQQQQQEEEKEKEEDVCLLNVYKSLILGCIVYEKYDLIFELFDCKMRSSFLRILKSTEDYAQERVGERRIVIIQIFYELIVKGFTSFPLPIAQKFEDFLLEFDVLQIFTNLFFQFPNNNYYQYYYTCILKYFLTFKEQEQQQEQQQKEKHFKIKIYLFETCKIMSLILNSIAQQQDQAKGQVKYSFSRMCNMGNIIELSNLINLEHNKQYYTVAKEEEEKEEKEELNMKWELFTMNELKEENENQKKELGGTHPLKMMEGAGGNRNGENGDDDNDSDSSFSSSDDDDDFSSSSDEYSSSDDEDSDSDDDDPTFISKKSKNKKKQQEEEEKEKKKEIPKSLMKKKKKKKNDDDDDDDSDDDDSDDDDSDDDSYEDDDSDDDSDDDDETFVRKTKKKEVSPLRGKVFVPEKEDTSNQKESNKIVVGEGQNKSNEQNEKVKPEKDLPTPHQQHQQSTTATSSTTTNQKKKLTNKKKKNKKDDDSSDSDSDSDDSDFSDDSSDEEDSEDDDDDDDDDRSGDLFLLLNSSKKKKKNDDEVTEKATHPEFHLKNEKGASKKNKKESSPSPVVSLAEELGVKKTANNVEEERKNMELKLEEKDRKIGELERKLEEEKRMNEQLRKEIEELRNELSN